MKLSDGEKLIISMLADIHKALKIQNSVNPDLISEAIYSGNAWGLKWAYPGIFGASEVDHDAVLETCDILEMWTMLEEAYGALTTEQQKAVVDQSGHAIPVRFPGFDGNNEGEFISIASFLINQLDRFTHFAGRDLNAHMMTIEMHRRMLPVYRATRRNLMGRRMTIAEIGAVLAERIHPDHRK